MLPVAKLSAGRLAAGRNSIWCTKDPMAFNARSPTWKPSAEVEAYPRRNGSLQAGEH